jgi:peptide deformylase
MVSAPRRPAYNRPSMAILKVARMGHPVLRAKALPVPKDQISSPGVQRLIDDMFETMREYSGIGLAAPQIHQGVRIFVAGLREGRVSGGVVPDDEDMPYMALINPELTLLTESNQEGWEGCLSIPDIRGLVPRAAEVKVQAYDRTGARVSFTAKGPARPRHTARNGSPGRGAVLRSHAIARVARVHGRVPPLLGRGRG